MRYVRPLLILAACTSTAWGDEGAFTKGPIFADYGPVAEVDTTMPIAQDAVFRHSFDDLLPGVEMALSAMTAHALLQQQGYTLNPF